MSADIVAERYAGALFALAHEKGLLKDVGMELNRLLAIMREEPRLSHALVAPDVPSEVKKNIVRTLFAKRISPLLLNFLYLVVEWRRGEVLEGVVEHFHVLVHKVEGKVKVDATVAVDLSAELKKSVEKRVSQITGRTAVMDWHTDPEILGGIVISVNDTLIDYSLRTQLNEMKELLSRASA